MEYINCNLCGSSKAKVLISEGPFNIVQCKQCGLVYKNPRLSEEEMLEEFISKSISLQHKRVIWYDSKIELFKKNLERIERYSSKGRMLDVGCGYGTFLKMAKDNGWQVRGVEITNPAYKYVKEKLGLNIFKGTLKKAHFPDEYFDVITLWDLLDQLNDPFAELLEINRILKRDGLVIFRMRNVTFHFITHLMFGKLVEKLKINPPIFLLYGFSRRTVEKMLSKAGFRNIKVVNSELTKGDPYSTGETFTGFGMRLIKKLTLSLCQLIFYLTGGLLVLGPSILVFANKPLNNSKKSYVKN